MIFVYSKWQEFCKKLNDLNIHGVTAMNIVENNYSTPYLVLKHDVETDVKRALEMAKIEYKYGHKGSYYVQAYLLEDKNNIEILRKIKNLGHEVSYHYDVMDSNKGDIKAADIEFEKNKKLFESNGFNVITVCQHGNPIVERIGYTSNRDFFRNKIIQKKYKKISDIMVNFKEYANTDYVYYSDAGRHFQMIFDPLFNDVINSDNKNVKYEDLNQLLVKAEIGKSNCIISTHPHRWTNSAFVYRLKDFTFKVVKKIAKFLIKVPFFKKIMNKYYYLAKKI